MNSVSGMLAGATRSMELLALSNQRSHIILLLSFQLVIHPGLQDRGVFSPVFAAPCGDALDRSHVNKRPNPRGLGGRM